MAKIARVDLIYDNQYMLDLLMKRGQAIKVKNKEAIVKLEELIHA